MAQADDFLSIEGKFSLYKEKTENVKVLVFEAGKQIESFELGKAKRYKLAFDFGQVYQVHFIHDAMVTQIIDVNAKLPPSALELEGFPPFTFDITLFKKESGVNYSELSNPIAFIQYNEVIDHFDANFDAYNSMLSTYTSKVKATESNEEELDREKAYSNAINEADKLFKMNDLKAAKQLYEQAMYFKPGEAYPKEKIVEINQFFINEQKLAQETAAKEKEYQGIISSADKLYKKGDLDEARMEYLKARNLKPNDEYIQYKLEDIQAVKVIKEKDEQYLQLINRADKFFTDEKYEDAKKEFEAALALKPDEKYPPRKLNEISILLDRSEKMKEQQAKVDKAYQDYLSLADQLFNQSKYDEARPNYVNAANIKPDEAYPRKKISEIDQLLAGAEEAEARSRINRELYQSFVKKADEAFAIPNFSLAKSNYEEALNLFPEEVYPKQQLAAIEAQLEKLKKEEDNFGQINQAYQAAIERGDKAFSGSAYVLAKTAYEEALQIKPNEEYPRNKLNEIAGILKNEKLALEQQELHNQQYQTLINEADKKLENKQLISAKETYQSALQLKPGEAYPNSKIIEIDALLAKQLEADSRNKQYSDWVNKGDNHFNQQDYLAAKQAYSQALLLKPDKPYPQERINEIERLLANEEANLELRREQDQAYLQLISKADELYQQKFFEQALPVYKEANVLKPQEVYPPQRIAEIEKQFAGQQAAQDKAYNDWVNQGDALFNATKYSEAKGSYQNALNVKPDKAYPRERINEIERLLADAKDAKEKSRLRDESYARLIAEADINFNKQDYSLALSTYKEALSLKPMEEYPKKQISAIEKQFADQQRAENERERKEIAYLDAIANGDRSFSAKEYSQAKEQYQEALSYKPKENYPLSQIERIEKILAALEAADAEQRMIRNRYEDLIFAGDQAFDKKDYPLSRQKFQEAGRTLPDENYPPKRLKDIEDAIKSDAEYAKNRALDSQYNEQILKADKAYEISDLPEALNYYRAALLLKPLESYPESMIKKILLQQNQQKEEKIAQSKANSSYESYIQMADSLFNLSSYFEARPFYVKASEAIPSEAYPRERLKEIDWILREKNIATSAPLNEDDPYFDALQKADEAFYDGELSVARFYYRQASAARSFEIYPIEQLDLIESRLKNRHLSKLENDYRDHIKKGDEWFSQEEYPSSRFYFRKALGIKPDANYPKIRLNDIDEALRMRKLNEKFAEYEKLMNWAESALLEKEYAVAEFYLEKANRIKGNQLDPVERLKEIERLKDGLLSDEVNEQFNKALEKADEHYLNEDFNSARFFYRKALEYKPQDQHCTKQLEEIQRYFNPAFEPNR